MKTHLKLISALAAVSVAGALSTKASESSESYDAGLIGKRYAEVSYGTYHEAATKTDAYYLSSVVNIPVTTSIDVGLNYDYSWLEGNNEIDNHLLDVYVTGYEQIGEFKTFATLAFGHNWEDQTVDESVWSSAIGAEYSLAPKASVAASVGYADDFHGPADDGVWSVNTRANYWITENLAGILRVNFLEGGDVSASLGVALKF